MENQKRSYKNKGSMVIKVMRFYISRPIKKNIPQAVYMSLHKNVKPYPGSSTNNTPMENND
jgi:hypothetical protein